VCVVGGPLVGRWIVVYGGGGKVPIVAGCVQEGEGEAACESGGNGIEFGGRGGDVDGG